MRNVLITGATGFIGSHVVKANLARGNFVRALVLPGDLSMDALKQRGVEVVTGDIRDYENVSRAVVGIDIIFHCAAVVTDWAPEKLFYDVTVGGTENICRAALEAGVRRFVDVSSSEVFGVDESKILDETCPLRYRGEPYPDSKIDAEHVVWDYFKKGLPVTVVYPAQVYGEGDYTFLTALADAIIKKELVFWRENIGWPTYIDNLVDLMMLVAEDDRAVGNGYLVRVHDGESNTLEAFCAGLAEALEVPACHTYIPYRVAMSSAKALEFVWRLFRIKTRPLLTTYTVTTFGSRMRLSIEKARRELGWAPKVSYRDGFVLTLAWVKTLNLKELKYRQA